MLSEKEELGVFWKFQQFQIPGHQPHEGSLEQTECVYMKVVFKQSSWRSLETTHPINLSVSKESDCVRRCFFDVICSDFVSGTPETLQSALPFCSPGFTVSDFFHLSFFNSSRDVHLFASPVNDFPFNSCVSLS